MVGMEGMIKMIIGALGIKPEPLIANLQQFQQAVGHAVKTHDDRLIALEVQVKLLNEKLGLILTHLGIEHGYDAIGSNEHDACYFDADNGPVAGDAAIGQH